MCEVLYDFSVLLRIPHIHVFEKCVLVTSPLKMTLNKSTILELYSAFPAGSCKVRNHSWETLKEIIIVS